MSPAPLLLALVVGLAAAQDAPKAPPEAKSKRPETEQFLRLVRDDRRVPVALEAAIVRHVPAAKPRVGLSVDLISAVHIAEKSYYDEINKAFEGYDCVLYELVAPQGTRVPKGGGSGSGSFVSTIQKGMKDVLSLEFQLDRIDYSRKNMVHADMSPEQFSKSMRNRGESVWAMVVRMMGYALAKQGQGDATDVDLLLALFDKDRAVALKRVLAEQFQDMEGSLLALEGPEGSTLISERNKVAMGVLREQVAAGRKRIAIFYGAGHMPDFQRRLRDELGLVPQQPRWLVAWDLKRKGAAGKPAR